MVKLHRLMPDSVFTQAFRVVRAIGEGAIGTVYLATRVGDGKPVAVKVLKPSAADDERMAERFLREARVGDRIGHEHVVKVFDTGFDERTGLHWISMEYLEGQPLGDFIAGRPDPAVRVSLLGQLFDAMAAAHRAGVIHRDLKPENVFVVDGSPQPVLKVLDFGIAKFVGPSMSASLTEEGLGTPMWTAPEQGKRGNVHPAADVWSLGLLTFFTLTGTIFWRHATGAASSMIDIVQEMLLEPIPAASQRAAELGATGLPLGFDAWFARAVHRDPAHRFPTADHARAALFPLLGVAAPAPVPLPVARAAPSPPEGLVPPVAALGPPPLDAPTTAVSAPASGAPRRSPTALVVIATLVALSLGALALWLFS